jgi:hypothetical protein
MKTVLAVGAAVGACAVAAGLFFGIGRAPVQAEPGPAEAAEAVALVPQPPQPPGRFIVHEWGTFTSFSGSDGVPVHFFPDNSDLPAFVYHQPGDGLSKSNLLNKDGTVSMETPVLYFYADRPMRASVRVDFPKGWITEWYPFAAAAPFPDRKDPNLRGQSIRWDVRLLAGESARFPVLPGQQNNRYYQARATDAVPLQAEIAAPDDGYNHALQGGNIVQREKFLFYRGVGTFPPPVTIRAVGGGRVVIKNTTPTRIPFPVLVMVKGGKVGFRTQDGCLVPGDGTEMTLPEADRTPADLAEVMVKQLTAAGLYEKEARAMVKTWDTAWFGEDGTRVLYLVPRARTDELLPLAVEPKPDEVVRVLVGRHDFLTPEQEADAERQLRRVKAAQAELEAAEKELGGIGRFSHQARMMAEQRLQRQAARK